MCIDKTKTVPTKIVPTKSISTNFHILLVFLSISTALSITVGFYCLFIKHQAKQKPLLSYHYTISKLKETGY